MIRNFSDAQKSVPSTETPLEIEMLEMLLKHRPKGGRGMTFSFPSSSTAVSDVATSSSEQEDLKKAA